MHIKHNPQFDRIETKTLKRLALKDKDARTELFLRKLNWLCGLAVRSLQEKRRANPSWFKKG
jgi:hypothetical protein